MLLSLDAEYEKQELTNEIELVRNENSGIFLARKFFFVYQIVLNFLIDVIFSHHWSSTREF